MTAKRMSKNKGSRKRYASYADRSRRMLTGVTVTGWDSDDNESGFLGRTTFPATTPISKRVSLHDFMMETPNRWHITARVIVRYESGEQFYEDVEAVTGQALVLHELTEQRKKLMADATANINPKYVEGRVYIMRLARKGDMA